jgi:hypothetical protein
MTFEELEKRVQVLEDIEQIKRLQIRYVNCLTTTDWDGLVDCFAEDAFVALSAGYRGKKEIAGFYRGEITLTHIGREGNYVVHPLVEVDGDRARGSWLLYTMFSQPHQLQTGAIPVPEDAPDWIQGFYEMEYIRENGRWKISKLDWKMRLVSPKPPESSALNRILDRT